MYNKAKHLIGKIAAISAIVLGSVMLAYELYSLIAILIDARDPSVKLSVSSAFVNLLFFTRFLPRLALGGVCLFLGIKNLRQPFFREYIKNGSWLYVPIKISVLLMVFCGALIFCGYYDLSFATTARVKLGGGYYMPNTFFKFMQYLQMAVAFAILVLKIVALALRGDVKQEEAQEIVADNSCVENE